ncbi:heat shock protein 60 family co-chaperone [Salmonella phage SE_PL]|uniref:GroES family chaperonin n=1 Tax=Salmonella enterica TaxID=28901 RepID=UPI000FDF76B9|nr:chaperonin [Salmonella phage Munch]EAZ2023078.1 co-chaperone GroES [Salmonella enterica]ECV9083724.1 co-chaperone GroES [Salmonella enterica subsp. enterica serovar Infantis]MCP0435685.1 co-chaperone GroES [Salmonella enterica subsp. enterica serovar Mbandaka]QCW18991.1 heat shock protein 60 family co-caperone Gro ES [Salmonella phage 7t3]QIG62745.1 heat shock protein 60 family co-chaperone [Salmonella phage SE_PL]
MSTLKMINDYVLVELVENHTTSTGGIILTNVEPPCIGRVVSVGPGRILNNGERAEHNIEVGEEIVFGKSSLNQPLEHEKVTYYVMKIDEVFGKRNG